MLLGIERSITSAHLGHNNIINNNNNDSVLILGTSYGEVVRMQIGETLL